MSQLFQEEKNTSFRVEKYTGGCFEDLKRKKKNETDILDKFQRKKT